MSNIETINLALLSIVSLTNLALAFLIFKYGQRNRPQKWFIGVIASTVAWTIVNYLADHITNHFWSLVWTKMTFSTTAFLAWFVFLFALEFGNEEKYKRKTIFLFAIPNLIIQALLFSPLIVKDITRYERGVNVVFGRFDFLFTAYFIGILLVSFVLLIKKFIQVKNKEARSQLLFMLVGFGLFLTAGTITNYLIPILFNYFYASVFGPYFSIFFIGSTTYAILRHKLLGMNILAPQIFSLFIGAILFVEVLISPNITQAIIHLVIFLWYLVLSYLLLKSIRHELSLVKELENANVRLKQLMEIKNEFLQIASHQLRTPVSVMRGMLDMLREDKGQLTHEQRKQFIDRAYYKSQKLVQIISDVLSATEMDVPDFNISGTTKQMNLAELAQKTVEASKKDAEEKGINLTCEIQGKIPSVEASYIYLPQAVNNLVDNAIKYTKKGSVKVMVYLQEGNVVYAVRDTGIGVPKEDISGLWNKFKRAKNARDMETDGSGLGLFIVKKIIEGHKGGKVFLESELGKGSTFGFQLPIM